MLGVCVCGFAPPKNVKPTSPAYHRLHKTAHLERFPKAGKATEEALDDLIARAERRELVERARVS